VGKLLVLLFISSIVIGCLTTDKIDDTTVLSGHYDSIIQQLTIDEIKLTKYIIKNEKRDTVYIDSVNWKQELSLFLESDISKKKINKYKITIFEDSCTFLFQTTTDKQPVKKLKYSICNNDLIVNIDVEKRSKIYDYIYYLELTSSGYLIEVKQKVKMAYQSKYIIEGKFRK